MSLLRDEENRYCADCEAKGPRWASWNIGIFVCIRCAGIHRKLGVHISKVKSINLDSWTPEQVNLTGFFLFHLFIHHAGGVHVLHRQQCCQGSLRALTTGTLSSTAVGPST